MNILFVFTGGTIGSTVKSGVADTDSDTIRQIASFCGDCGDDLTFSSPFQILSENSTRKTLSDILNFMLSIDYDKYDGVIVTHGSDTLAYTANLLGLALSFVKIPIVITAANYVISDPRSNAAENIRAAYRVIREHHEGLHKLSGAFVVWTNPGGCPKIYEADKLLEADGLTDKFDCEGGIPLAALLGDRFVYHKDIANEREDPGALAFLKGRSVTLSARVLLLHSYVGMDYSDYNIKGKAAVLLKLYHSGTACMAGERTAFKFLAERCREEGVKLYITPVKHGDYIYRSAEGFGNSSATALCMSEIAAYTGLMLAYSLEGEEQNTVIDTLIHRGIR